LKPLVRAIAEFWHPTSSPPALSGGRPGDGSRWRATSVSTWSRERRIDCGGGCSHRVRQRGPRRRTSPTPAPETPARSALCHPRA
jgi:hypothetical protein